ncbi:sensor histidine kinase [Ectobacillus panaciterrae]|uniref:sensor histidine kinase n=1 Tax=Ectobacillus panaciterrae TaxID=363872 RepID=UPI0003FAE80B|nr:HAMP domain-containing sensor histidine kinase [Ectobacillus panaciterrae]
MRTLYLQFVVTSICIMIMSSIIAFGVSNAYYQIYLKPFNDQKITKMAKETASFYEKSPQNIDEYMKHAASLGYQIYLADGYKKGTFYGSPFHDTKLNDKVISSVLNGHEYHGILQFPKKWFITGFFDDVLANTIGVPIQAGKTRYAMFIRPDIEQQFGEMRIFFAQLLMFTICFSIILIFIGTRYVVKPIRMLTKATKKIAEGNYNIRLDVDRRDEIGTLSKNFSRMAESLERLEEMRQEFVSNVSHEIQSPLASIQGFSQALRSKQVTEQQYDHYLSIIEEESRRLSLLSKQLLMLASLDKEKDIWEKTKFDLADQMKQVLSATEWHWREKDLAMDINLPSTEIQGDKRLLHQVWMNLIYNSIKFTEAGGTIFISLHNEDQKHVHVIVADTGVGISEEDLPHIFDRYYKADKSRKREESGSGLGLSIVKKIIELHQGTMTVESEEGKGTRFEVILPYM